MMGIGSPFIQDIPKCKTSMRKLRKKIYKYTVAQSKPRKTRDCTQQIFNILQLRQVPEFVIESLRKKRTLDLSALKNVVISMGSSLQEMTSLVRNQQKEVESIFKDHKLRTKMARRPLLKLQNRPTTISSTEEQVVSQFSVRSIQQSQMYSGTGSGSQCIMGGSFDYLALSSTLLSEEALFSF